MSGLKDIFRQTLDAAREACVEFYGERLVSLAVYGSVARGTMRHDSDIDLLLVVDPLPDGRMPRMDEFREVERRLEAVLQAAAQGGVHTVLSPVFKTPAELRRGSLLFLDMTDQAQILFDKGGTLRTYLDGLSQRLAAMGAKRIRKGGGYYWLLKPDLEPGEDLVL